MSIETTSQLDNQVVFSMHFTYTHTKKNLVFILNKRGLHILLLSVEILQREVIISTANCYVQPIAMMYSVDWTAACFTLQQKGIRTYEIIWSKFAELSTPGSMTFQLSAYVHALLVPLAQMAKFILFSDTLKSNFSAAFDVLLKILLWDRT